jgi:phage gpG-like protein
MFVEIDCMPSALLIAADFYAWANAVEDVRDPLKKAIQEVVIPSIAKNFDDEGNPPWAELTDETLAKRSWAGFAEGPILDRTGALRSAATSVEAWEFDDDVAQMTMPGETPYGTFHQGGTSQMPERPFAMFGDDDLETIQETFGDWMMDLASKAGF